MMGNFTPGVSESKGKEGSAVIERHLPSQGQRWKMIALKSALAVPIGVGIFIFLYLQKALMRQEFTGVCIFLPSRNGGRPKQATESLVRIQLAS